MDKTISLQAAIDVLNVLSHEHRYKIPGERETYSQYNEAWQDALGRAETAIENLPSAQPEIIHCRDCTHFCRAEGEESDWCYAWGDVTNEDAFCSYAERRTDATD